MTRFFSRWLRKSDLTRGRLCEAVVEMSNGLIDADLGGGVYKKRIALPGRGKRGGARTLVATSRSDRWFFMFGFEKNEWENVTDKELEALKMEAADLLGLSTVQLSKAVTEGVLTEICHDDESKAQEPNS